MDLQELKSLLQLLDEKDVAEFELEEDGRKIRIRKASPGPHDHTVPAPVGPSAAGTPGAARPPAPSPAAPGPTTAPTEVTDNHLVLVKSPIVGTFYRSADPNSPPFVSVGDKVRVGQVLCIIEAMKLMNEIEAEVAGEIVRIQCENGQPVQFGDALFALHPDN